MDTKIRNYTFRWNTLYLEAFEADSVEIELGSVTQWLAMETSDRQRLHTHVTVVFHRWLEEQSVEQRKVMVDDQLGAADDAVDCGTPGGTQCHQHVCSQSVFPVRRVVAGCLYLVRVAVDRQRPEGGQFGRRSLTKDVSPTAGVRRTTDSRPGNRSTGPRGRRRLPASGRWTRGTGGWCAVWRHRVRTCSISSGTADPAVSRSMWRHVAVHWWNCMRHQVRLRRTPGS